MMYLRKYLSVIVLLFSYVSTSFLPLCVTANQNEEGHFKVKGSKVILISAIMLDARYRKISGDEALLITNAKELETLIQLFDGNDYGTQHACGYHWRITFQKTSFDKTDIFFNQECEEFENNTSRIHSFLKPRFELMVTSPKFFITNIELSSMFDAEEAMKLIEQEKQFQIFFLDDLKERLPFVTLIATSVSKIPDKREWWNSATEENEKKAISIVQRELEAIKAKYKIVSTTTPQRTGSMFGGSEISDDAEVTIYFPIGTKLYDIRSELKKAKIKEMKNPESYFIQLVSTERCTKEFAEKLKEKFPFIKNAFAYPNEN